MTEPGEHPPVVFVVDDDRHVRHALNRILTAAGYRVYTFDSAAAAEPEIASRRARVLISDNYMPGKEGIVFLQELRREYPALRTILLTGGHITEAIHCAVATGKIDALVRKPWDLTELKAIIRRLATSSASE